ncbi:hypothetical protein ACHMWN_08970 [Pedobacter sp. UC225_61]|uniref:hypothetical protein n=1 Tax=Pedobacter sp. UC225_61 TaxID=3374623 RepID=UPI0037BA0198
MKNQTILSLLICCLFLMSCFHKSPETAAADDVAQILICETGTQSYLVSKEEIFQASSKSSGPRGTYISGYKQYRYSVRSANSGKLLTRLVSEPDADFNLLGFDGKLLWCYSADPKIGLHARNPVSLKIVINNSRIIALNPAIVQMPVVPLYQAYRFYQFDCEQQSIVLLNNTGFVFRLNTKTLSALKEKAMPANLNPILYSLSSVVYLDAERQVSLTSDVRNYFRKGNSSGYSFLMGKLLVENDRQKIAAFKHRILREIGATKWDALSLQSSLSAVSLGINSNTVYVMEATDLQDTASIHLSAHHVVGNSYEKKWGSTIGGIYYNYAAALRANPKAMVFSSGNPDYDYEWFGVTNGVLVGVRMLYMFGLDTNSGKLLWKVKV